MSIIASRITATLTALIAICGAVVYLLSPARDGVITSFPVILAVLGLLGPCAIIAAHRDSDTMALHIVAVICGVLVALAFNTVMSIGPLAGLSAFTLALSLVIICRSKRERLRPMILTNRDRHSPTLVSHPAQPARSSFHGRLSGSHLHR